MPIISSTGTATTKAYGGIGSSAGGGAAAEGAAEFLTETTDINSHQSWTVPAGVTSVDISMIGAGGGGAQGRYSYGSGGGGGGGGYVYVTGLSVTAGETFYFIIGKGGTGGYQSTNSPFETVNGASAVYPTNETNGTDGGDTRLSYTGDPNYSGNTSYILTAFGGQNPGASSGGGIGGGTSYANWVNQNSTLTVLTGYNARSAQGSGLIQAGGGGGCAYGGYGGYGIGSFHRSSGGFNYHKAATGGDGGGMRLLGGTNSGGNGTNAPAMGTTSPYNYTVAGDGYPGGTGTGSAYGGGGGGGAGGQIRNQNIITGGGSFTYRWFLGKAGTAGKQGAIRFSYPGTPSTQTWTGGEYVSASAVTHSQWRTSNDSTTNNTQIWIRQQIAGGGQSQSATAIGLRNALDGLSAGDTIKVTSYNPDKTFTISGGVSSQVGYLGNNNYKSWFFDVDAQGLSSSQYFYQFDVVG